VVHREPGKQLHLPPINQLDKFKSRRSLLQSTEKSLNTSCLRPVNGIVRLHNNSLVTVPIFDAKHMIISLLTDPSLMKQSNFAEGYNILTGEVINDNLSLLLLLDTIGGKGVAQLHNSCPPITNYKI